MAETLFTVFFGWVLGTASAGAIAMYNAARRRDRRLMIKKVAAGFAIGVSLRNSAGELESKAERDKWRVEAQEWKKEIVKNAQEVDYAKAQNIQTLDRYAPVKFGNVDEDSQHELGILHETLSRVSQFLAEVS